MSSFFAPNRLATYLTIAAGVATAIAPAVADLDTTSVITLGLGLGGIVGAFWKWMTGWQQHEERLASAAADDPAFPVADDEAQNAEVAVV
jgi:hypothetical protein